MTDRRKLAIAALAVVTIVAVRHPTPNIRLLTHDVGDTQPHRVQAAIDLGLMGFSVLYTWTARRT
ncbi:hypothetical protein NF700_07590 [Sphingomonadaceae bacterium OTU29MARTA1]|uniref:hypothetical protein n=1 Tax=Sphingomonas sp. Leaf37 TaxID=2876552 RepID=UPI001E5CD1FB|nr:hypothetical protein [Sphingomonas sp. Leaf37]USU06739.1 hypothetical protein NF699_08805 [Sphingomonadaceae bacterium OTU29LAMAA1]USU10108.1 hypothetical protein NF700_07590 [Sphingomonadaceae bacterium OTU29MARTA1]USU13556.1 hypothetical protein NF701_06970 [Sphingomonadaceae bacterium OTU29THOMA1]